LRVGLTIGALMGIMAGLMASLWLGFPMLGLAVGLALFATMTVASLLGFLVPFILIKLNIDQAAGSAPIITTIKDLVALLIYFTCISLFLGHLIT
ncbi:MAG: magnesium transporter, partial [Lactococcus sp.]